MKNNLFKFILMCTMTFSIMVGHMNPISASSRTYQITYSAGLIGEFKESLINSYKENYGTQNITVSKATGNITIKVIAHKVMPNAPTARDIVFKDKEYEETYYVLTSGWQPTATTVSENATYVVQYGSLSKGVEYTIRYVDKITNQDVAAPVISRANVNEVMNAYAKMVDGYTFDNQTKSITLTEDRQKNVLTFYYTAKDNTIIVDQVEEKTVISNQTVTPPPNNNQNEDVTIPDNDTPLADTFNPNDKRDTTIDDNETPLAKADELTQNNQKLYLIIIGIGIIFIIGCIVVSKRKKQR